MIGTIIKYHIFDIGLNLMFDNIFKNFNTVKKIRKIPFAPELCIETKCAVLICMDGENSDWYDDMMIYEIGTHGVAFRSLSGIEIRPLYDQILSIIEIQNFGDTEGDEYTNDYYIQIYTDKDGNIRNLDTDELIDMDTNDIIKHNESINNLLTNS